MNEVTLVREALTETPQRATAIADTTGLTVPTVTGVLNLMVDAGEVRWEKVDAYLVYSL